MEYYLAVALFAISSSITPGPNNIMMMTSGMNYGVRRSMPHLLGILVGFPVMLITIGLSFGVIFEAFPVIHEVIKIAGVLYLAYLAWLIAGAKPKTLEVEASNPIGFWQAFWFQWLNPKAWAMGTGAIAAFTTQGSAIYFQVLAIAFIFFLTVIPCTGSWMFFGIGLKRFLNDPFWQRTFNVTMAILLVVSILPVIQELVVHYLL